MKYITLCLSILTVAFSLSACKQTGKKSEVQRYAITADRVELGPKKCKVARSKAEGIYVPVYSAPEDSKKLSIGVARGSDTSPITIQVIENAGDTFVKVRLQGPTTIDKTKVYFTKKNSVKIECLEDGSIDESVKPYMEKMTDYNITERLEKSLGIEEKVGNKLGVYICKGELKERLNDPAFANFTLFGRYGNPGIPALDGKPTSAHLEITYNGTPNPPEFQPLTFSSYNGVNSWIYERGGSVLRIKIGRENNRTVAKLIKVNSGIFSSKSLVPYTLSQACQFYPQEKAEFLEYLDEVDAETLVCGAEKDDFYYQVEANYSNSLGTIVVNKDPAPIITVFGGTNKNSIQERKALDTVGRTWLTKKTFVLDPAFPEVTFNLWLKNDGTKGVKGSVKVVHNISLGSGQYSGTIRDIELTCPTERRKKAQ